MSNKSLENVNSQFIDVLKSLNIEDEKHQKLSINLDLNKKIKTIISIQSLDERKSNIPKYLNNSKSYISLLSLSISLNTKTLYTIFYNNNGREILKEIIQNSEKEKASLAIDLVYRLIKTYGMDFDMKLLITKACEFEKWEILDIVENFEIFFEGDCICKMLIYTFLHKFPEQFVCKIQQSKFSNLYKYIKDNEINALETDGIFSVQNLEKIILNTSYIRKEKGESIKVLNEPINLNKETLNNIVEIKSEVEPCKIIEPIDTKLEEKVIAEPVQPQEKKVLKKKMIIKKKESSVSYMPIKWSKIPKEDTIFKNLDVEKYKTFFTKEDLEYFVIKKELKKEVEKENLNKKEALIDPKKAYALNIALSRIKCNYKVVVSEILNQDCNSLSENLVIQLLLYFPTEQEMSNILSSDSDNKYVLFFRECEDCHLDVKENLKGMKLNFLIKSCNISNITYFTNFFTDLSTSNYIRTLLGSILYIGNIVNKGSTYGNAEGFNLNDIRDILNMRISSGQGLPTLGCPNKVSDMKNNKTLNICTFKELLRQKLPCNDIDLSIKKVSYDNLISEMTEIIALKKDYAYSHNEFDEIYKLYKTMIEARDQTGKLFAIDKFCDDLISDIIYLCEIKEKHN